MLYWILRPVCRLILWIFFRKIEVQGIKNLPEKGPLILAGNHPNMLLDALLLAAYSSRKVHYLAKSTLFKNPLSRMFLSSCGVIPLYRRMDNPAEMEKNQSSFEACYKILEKGGTIGIFPEGTSHAKPHLMSLKTGAARIALETEERNQNGLGIKILPVGLNFGHRETFRSQVLVLYGKPLEITDYLEMQRQDSREAARLLTGKIEEGLREVTLNINTFEDAEFIEKIEQIYRKEFLKQNVEMSEKHRLLTNLTFNQMLVDGYHYFDKTRPARVKNLKGEIDNYLDMIHQSDLHPDIVGLKIGRFRALFYLLSNLVLFLLGLPLALYGILNHFVPYQIPRWTAKKQGALLEEIATIKLIIGIMVFPCFYILQTLGVFFLASPEWAALYFISLPLSGLFTMVYLDHMILFLRGLWIYLRFVLHRDLKLLLEKKKSLILSELNQLTGEYMEIRKKEKENYE